MMTRISSKYRACWGLRASKAGQPGATVAWILVTVLLAGCSSGLIEDPPGEGAAGSGEGDGPTAREPFRPAPAVLPRLTSEQYRNSVRDLLGDGLPTPAVEADTNPHLFFSIGATTTELSELGAQQYEEAAHTLSEAAFADAERREALVGCEPAEPGDECARAFLEGFGKRAFRRPLEPAEVSRWVGVSRDLADGDPWRGLSLAVAGMLQSPSFLYRVELGEPDPNDDARFRYTSWEMASRLSFLLWNTTPDDELLAAAARGDLVSEGGIHEQASRLLDHPRARRAVQSFFAQYLDLGRLDGLTRDPTRYPHWTPTMARSMRTEIELLVDDLVFRREADVRELFSSRRTFVNAELAELYGVDAPGATEVAFVPVELPADGPRMGVLTLGGFLAMNAHETETSPTLRGKYVRERVLCQTVPPPPDDVDTSIAEPDGTARTLRERLEQHRRDPACATCHSFIDPPGFLFEHFDSAGAWRATDNGYPIDASGDLDEVPLRDARDLAEVLRDDPRVPRCMIQQLYRHATGRLEIASEGAQLEALERAFEASGHRFRELLLALATSEGFRTAAPPPEEETP